MNFRKLAWGLVFAAIAVMMAVPAAAEDKTGRWEVSIGWFMQETPSQTWGEFPRTLGQSVPEDFAFFDINDTFGVKSEAFHELGVTYHWRRWGNMGLDFELNYGVFESNMGRINLVDLTNRVWGADTDENNIGSGGTTVLTFESFEVGEVEHRQIVFSGKLRFNMDSRWNPYVALGIGNLNVDYDAHSDMAYLADFLYNSEQYDWFRETRDVGDRIRDDPFSIFLDSPNIIIETTNDDQCLANGAGFCPLGVPGIMTIDVDDGFLWQLRAGLEYQLGPNMTFFGEAKYNFSSGDFEITYNGGDHYIGVENGDEVIGWAYTFGSAAGSNISTGRGAFIVNGGSVNQDNLQVGGGFRWTF